VRNRPVTFSDTDTIPDPVQDAILKALNKERRGRYNSADEMTQVVLKELEQWLYRGQTLGEPKSPSADSLSPRLLTVGNWPNLGAVEQATFCAEGQYIVAAAEEHICFLSRKHPRQVRKLRWPGTNTGIACWGNNSLCTGDHEGLVRCWSLPSSKSARSATTVSLQPLKAAQLHAPITNLAISSEGNIAASTQRGVVLINEMEAPRILQLRSAAEVKCMAFSLLGWPLALGCNIGSVYLWSGMSSIMAANQEHLPRPPGVLIKSIRCLAFSLDGSYLASADNAGNFVVWELETTEDQGTVHYQGRIHSSFEVHPKASSIVFTSDPRVLFVGLENGTIECWQLDQPRQLGRWHTHTPLCSVNSLVYSVKDDSLISASSDGNVKLWQINWA
jgi:WD40 repeat protein